MYSSEIVSLDLFAACEPLWRMLKMKLRRMHTRNVASIEPRLSRHGRVLKRSRPFESETTLFSQRPSVVESNRRRMQSQRRRRVETQVAAASGDAVGEVCAWYPIHRLHPLFRHLCITEFLVSVEPLDYCVCW